MQEVRIRKFAAHYHLSGAALVARRRLDQVMKTVLDEAFEGALTGAGLPSDGELCMRQIHVPVRLRLTSADAALASEWGRALAAEIARALGDGRALFYRSRRQAWVDMAMSVARGDLRHAWAWRQLGLWHAGNEVSAESAIFELVRVATNEPAAVMTLLVALARAGVLVDFAGRLSARQWVALAQAALGEVGAIQLLASTVETPSARTMRDAWRVLNRSPFVSAFTGAPALSNSPTTEECCEAGRAVAALVVLEAEPALLRSIEAHTLIDVIAAALRSADQAAKQARDVPALEEASARSRASEQKRENVQPEEESKVVDLRRRARTSFGGLLFLLSLIEELQLVDEILAHPALGSGSFRWTMHQLACTLVPADEADPAALAFAGLPPDAALPLEREPPSEIESSALSELTERVVAHLGALLEWQDEPAALIEFVCRRRAEIVAEPGWIEVKLALDEVATEIRRAGLDLDPGYVPHLGVVVRFVYE